MLLMERHTTASRTRSEIGILLSTEASLEPPDWLDYLRAGYPQCPFFGPVVACLSPAADDTGAPGRTMTTRASKFEVAENGA
jgi:hypothetical protein